MKKMIYETPIVESIRFTFESEVLQTISGGRVNTPSGEGMTGSDVTEDW